MSRTRRLVLSMSTVLILSLALALPSTIAGSTSPAAAADGSLFDPGYIISDENFFDGAAMTGTQVQEFLDAKNQCGTASNCLAAYTQPTPSMPATRYCAAIDGWGSESAASIIARVGAACNISQRTLLVMLQKEQGLITSTSPSKYALDHALGQACPDTAPCDSAYAGFFAQVYYGSRQFQIYRWTATTGGWGYRAGQWNDILYHPDASRGCGTKSVFIRNQATAGLYIYTPYVPNAAALSNLYGTGDGCSSYGNRNFWRLWSDWFGDPTINTKSPIGVIKDMWTTEDGVAFWGWAVDPDTPTAALQIKVTVGGVVSYLTADSWNPAVAAGFPAAGPYHGFGGIVPAPPGTSQTICLTMVNQGGGSDQSLGCRGVDLPPRVSPRGELKDMWGTVAGVNMWGWAIDPDAVSASVALHIQVDGKKWYVLTADAPYAPGPDLVAGAGPNHGWGGVLPVGPGVHTVCATMINQNAGANTPFGCRQVTVPSIADVSPKGEVKDVSGVSGGVSLWGWAVDPDAQQAAVPVIVQVDSKWYAWNADAPSTAPLAAFPSAGSNHGWGGVAPATPGQHWVCVYYLNQKDGADVNTGCRQVTVPTPPDMSPKTNLMGAWASAGGITLWGYAVDPDSLEMPTDVVVHVDSQWLVWKATASYSPGADLVSGAGPNRGYVGEVSVGPGLHWLCAYAVNRNAGTDTPPQCAQIRTG